jgi:ABC-type transporter Mla MlaB component
MKKQVRPAAKARAAKKKAPARSAKPAKPASKAKPSGKQPAAAAIAVEAPRADSFLLTLEAGCTLRDIADLQFSLVAARGDPLLVDGGSVERIDTAGLQLLVALAQRQQRSGGRLEWKSVSTELQKGSERLGLGEALDLPAAGVAP